MTAQHVHRSPHCDACASCCVIGAALLVTAADSGVSAITNRLPCGASRVTSTGAGFFFSRVHAVITGLEILSQQRDRDLGVRAAHLHHVTALVTGTRCQMIKSGTMRILMIMSLLTLAFATVAQANPGSAY